MNRGEKRKRGQPLDSENRMGQETTTKKEIENQIKKNPSADSVIMMAKCFDEAKKKRETEDKSKDANSNGKGVKSKNKSKDRHQCVQLWKSQK